MILPRPERDSRTVRQDPTAAPAAGKPEPGTRSRVHGRSAATCKRRPVRMEVDGAVIHGHMVIDDDCGQAVYTVSGPRIAGTFTLRPHSAADSAHLTLFTVYCGHDRGPATPTKYTRGQRPTINGIEMVGEATVSRDDPPSVQNFARRFPSDEALPSRTEARLTALVTALVINLLQSADLHRLHRRAAFLDAETQRQILREQIAQQRHTLAEATAAVAARCAYDSAKAARYDAIIEKDAPPGPLIGPDGVRVPDPPPATLWCL